MWWCCTSSLWVHIDLFSSFHSSDEDIAVHVRSRHWVDERVGDYGKIDSSPLLISGPSSSLVPSHPSSPALCPPLPTSLFPSGYLPLLLSLALLYPLPSPRPPLPTSHLPAFVLSSFCRLDGMWRSTNDCKWESMLSAYLDKKESKSYHHPV